MSIDKRIGRQMPSRATTGDSRKFVKFRYNMANRMRGIGGLEVVGEALGYLK